MEILNFINLHLIKYLYIVVIIAIFIALIYLFVSAIIPVVKTLSELLISLTNINDKVESINEDLEKISYTLNNSLPLFVDIAFFVLVLKTILKDYRDTKKSKRSLIKSTVKEYGNLTRKHNRKIDPKLLIDIISLIKKFI